MAAQRISLELDSQMAFEALILQHLDTLPRERRQEWLRTLLVQGYLVEMRLLREIGPQGLGKIKTQSEDIRQKPLPASPFASWLAQSMPEMKSRAASLKNGRVEKRQEPIQANNHKPFAHLRKVIGD